MVAKLDFGRSQRRRFCSYHIQRVLHDTKDEADGNLLYKVFIRFVYCHYAYVNSCGWRSTMTRPF